MAMMRRKTPTISTTTPSDTPTAKPMILKRIGVCSRGPVLGATVGMGGVTVVGLVVGGVTVVGLAVMGGSHVAVVVLQNISQAVPFQPSAQ